MNKKELDLLDILKVIKTNIIFIFMITTIFGIFSVFYALNLEDSYRSSATAVFETNQEASIPNSLSSLASIGGVNLDSNSSASKKVIAIELMKSRHFSLNFVKKYDLAPILIAANSFDKINNNYIFDKNIYDPKTSQWNQSLPYIQNNYPNDEIILSKFNTAFTFTSGDGILKVSFDHLSPLHVKIWLDNYLNEITTIMKDRQRIKSENSIKYFNLELSKVSNINVQNSIYSLMQSAINELSLVETNQDYVFQIIDPPNQPSLKSGPFRSTICFTITIAGLLLSIILVIASKFVLNRDKLIF